MFRVQKLIYAEYRDIYEPVYVENPFTEVDEEGNGIRQLHIGLTNTKLIIGSDDFDEVNLERVQYRGDVDPEIETFRLISIVPLQMVKLHFFRRGQREVMKMIPYGSEDQPKYYEFGGHKFRIYFWHVWRDRVCKMHLWQPELIHLTGASPFSSTDVMNEDELCTASVYSQPSSSAIRR